MPEHRDPGHHLRLIARLRRDADSAVTPPAANLSDRIIAALPAHAPRRRQPALIFVLPTAAAAALLLAVIGVTFSRSALPSTSQPASPSVSMVAVKSPPLPTPPLPSVEILLASLDAPLSAELTRIEQDSQRLTEFFNAAVGNPLRAAADLGTAKAQ